ncbi:MAG: DUF805 domain-containing protein [Roseburia sp.]
MDRIKNGKLSRKAFWIIIIVIWGIEIALALVGYDYEHEALPTWRLIAIAVTLVFYLVAIILRLRDAGKGIGMAIICMFIPVFMFVIGSWPSVEEGEAPVKKRKQEYGRF